MRTHLIASLALLFVVSFPRLAVGQTPVDEGRARLDYLVGTWDATTTILDRDGNVVRTEQSVDLIEPLIGNSVLMTTNVGADGTVRKSLRFYDRSEERFYEISVGEAGDVWILSGGMDAYEMTSQARSTPNGGKLMVRFTHTNIQPDSFEATMETSRDGGATWRRANQIQRLVRRTPGRR